MSGPVIFSACIGLIFLGITSSVSLGVQNSQFLSQPTNIKESVPNDNKQNLRLIKVNQEQYASNEANGRGNRSETPKKSLIQKRQTQPQENAVYDSEPEEEGFEHFAAKRAAQARGNVEEMGFKSKPGFRSWGGKRSKFMNWGGKRNTFSRWGGKRSKFNNWGGKRNEYLNENTATTPYEPEICHISDEEPELIQMEGKLYESNRGKRDPEYPSPYEQEGDPAEKYLDYEFLKRDEFQTWAGKRAEKPIAPAMDYNKFSKWGGKRKFSNWAGKRGSERLDDASTNWILRSYVNSIFNLLQNEGSIKNNHAFERNPFQEEAESTKTRFYEGEDSR